MVGVVTESTADIPPEMAERLGIAIVPSYVVFGSQTYLDGVELSKEEFYAKLGTSRVIPTTATPPPATYEVVYRRLAETTDEIISIHLAGNLSSLYKVAQVAARNVPQARIAVLDSQQATMGYGWLVVAAAEAAQRGESLDQIVGLVEQLKNRTRVLAVLDTLEFLHRGGRVGWAKAMIGTLLRIKPIIEVRQGQVALVERARTRRRSLERLVGQIRALGLLERAIVLHTNAPDEARWLSSQLETLLEGWQPLETQAGVTIASHVGPGAVGIACITRE